MMMALACKNTRTELQTA